MTKKERNIIVGLLVLGLSLAGAFMFFNMARAGSFILDLNPSIELNTNRLGKVTSLRAINKDGQSIIKSVKIDDNSLENVIGVLVDAGISKGYIRADSKNFILVSDDSKSPEELSEIGSVIDSYLEKKKLDASVATMLTPQTYDKEDLARIQISPAKMRLIEEIRNLDTSYSAEDLKDLSIKELFTLIESKGSDLDKVLLAYDDDFKLGLGEGLDQVAKEDLIEEDDPSLQKQKPSQDLPLGLKLSAKEAAQILLKAYPDAVIEEINLDNDDGDWEFDVYGKTKGQRIKMTLDALTKEVKDKTVDDDTNTQGQGVDFAKALSVDEVVKKSKDAGIEKISSLKLKKEGKDDFWKVDNKDGGNDIKIGALTGQVSLDDRSDDDMDDKAKIAPIKADEKKENAKEVQPAPKAPVQVMAPRDDYDDDWDDLDDSYDDYNDDWDDDWEDDSYDDDWDDDYDDDYDDYDDDYDDDDD